MDDKGADVGHLWMIELLDDLRVYISTVGGICTYLMLLGLPVAFSV